MPAMPHCWSLEENNTDMKDSTYNTLVSLVFLFMEIDLGLCIVALWAASEIGMAGKLMLTAAIIPLGILLYLGYKAATD